MKNKKNKLGLAGLLLLAGCTTIKPGGSIDLAFVPSRADDKPMYNELMLGLEGYVQSSLDEFDLKVGGNADTYMGLPEKGQNIVGGFSPTRISYDFYSKLIVDKDLEFYLFHNCTHPIKDEEFWLKDEDGKAYIINHDSITKIGIKYTF